MKFSSRILHWYYNNQRNLPWRESKNPYKVWISEIILQQTRVAQGVNYYKSFVATFPDIKDLASAEEEQVLKLWQGLGYYSRARNIHFSAKHIQHNLGGVFPSNYKDLIKLKGVGPYTAAAISSICYNEKRAAVDGNVYRVLARVFGISSAINSSLGIKEFQNLANSLISDKYPGDYNQGLMELGATVCTPKKADCLGCPLQSICIAFSKNTVALLPVKEKKLKIRNRYLNYYCIEYKNNILMNKREAKGIWQNLYDFPLEENDSEATISEDINSNYITNFIGTDEVNIVRTKTYKHKLSHQNLNITIHHIKTSQLQNCSTSKLYSKQQISNLPVPKPIEDFLNELFKQ